jgi:hypothetical protein
MGYRVPLFDVTVSAQKQSPYTKLSQNELAIQFFNAGFFDPTRAEQALACLEMMDFDRKDAVMKSIRDRALPGVAVPSAAMPSAVKDPVAKARARVAEVAAPR